MDWSRNALAVDVAYCNLIRNFQQFVDNQIYVALIKLTQGTETFDTKFNNHWARSRDVGMIRGAYVMFEGEHTALDQFNWIKKWYPRDAELPISVDVEIANGRDSAYLIKQLGNLLGLLTKEYGKKPILYTAGWFWNNNFKTPPGWLDEYDFWLASYLWYNGQNGGRINCTWQEFKTKWLSMNSKWVAPVNGAKKPAMWFQVTGDKFVIDSTPDGIVDIEGAIDINMFNGTLTELKARYGITGGITPPVEVKPSLPVYPKFKAFANPFLNVRVGPGTNYNRIKNYVVMPGAIVEGFEERNGWVKINPLLDQWVIKDFLTPA